MFGRLKFRKSYLALAFPVFAALAIPPAASLYYRSTEGAGCARCHEIRDNYAAWAASAHRKVPCEGCHGAEHVLDTGFHLGNLRRLVIHFRGDVPEQIRLRMTDVERMVERCRGCHQQEYSQWLAGPHSTTYGRIFLDEKHNKKALLRDDCFRCHGMHFEGGIGDLVTPVDRDGPWKMVKPEMAEKPAIPCLSCHSMHREGNPLRKRDPETKITAAREEIFRPSLALLDRREQRHLTTAQLPIPEMKEGARLVKMSTDRRQALCYQCHAPLSTKQVGTGDDRTPIGVHEGLSCPACHQKHNKTTRASCATCHPRLSNCGLDVEKMDTTFLNPESRHNIHTVKCLDCHPKGVPPKRRAAGDAVRTAAE